MTFCSLTTFLITTRGTAAAQPGKVSVPKATAVRTTALLVNAATTFCLKLTTAEELRMTWLLTPPNSCQANLGEQRTGRDTMMKMKKRRKRKEWSQKNARSLRRAQWKG